MTSFDKNETTQKQHLTERRALALSQRPADTLQYSTASPAWQGKSRHQCSLPSTSLPEPFGKPPIPRISLHWWQLIWHIYNACAKSLCLKAFLRSPQRWTDLQANSRIVLKLCKKLQRHISNVLQCHLYTYITIRCDKQPRSCIAAHPFVIWSPQILLASLYEGIYACNQAHTCDKLEGHTTELDSQGVFASIFPYLSLSASAHLLLHLPLFLSRYCRFLTPPCLQKHFFCIPSHSKCCHPWSLNVIGFALVESCRFLCFVWGAGFCSRGIFTAVTTCRCAAG